MVLVFGWESGVGMFGNGMAAALALRARMLESVGAGAAPVAARADSDADGARRTVIHVPVAGNRAELSLVYAAFLSHSVTRVPTDRDFDLVPRMPPLSRDPDVIGDWRHVPEGLAYGVVLPPASLIWPDHDPVVNMLPWVGRHIISRVREAFKKGSPDER